MFLNITYLDPVNKVSTTGRGQLVYDGENKHHESAW